MITEPIHEHKEIHSPRISLARSRKESIHSRSRRGTEHKRRSTGGSDGIYSSVNSGNIESLIIAEKLGDIYVGKSIPNMKKKEQ